MKKIKPQYLIEKETVTKEVNGDTLVTKTYRVIVVGEGNTRTIIFKPSDLKKFRDALNKVVID